MRQWDGSVELDTPRPCAHQHHPTADEHRFINVMGDEQHRLGFGLPDAKQKFLHQLAGLMIECAERLIHEQHARPIGERSRQRSALLHAARQLLRVVVLESIQPDFRDEALRNLNLLRPRQASFAQPETDVVEHAQPGEQRVALKHHAPVGAGSANRPVRGPGADRGMVFQSYTLFPWLSVLDNVCFGLRERGLARAQQVEIAQGFIAKVGLNGFEHHYPKQLSGGMQQRTALARALANGPRMLLMDEPFGALDHQTRELMQELLLGIWEAEAKTVLFVTHDIDEAVFIGSRVVLMSARPGRIKLDRPVPLPHPRHYSVKTAPEFSSLKAELTEAVRVEVLAGAFAP